jgi:hypothetical protein
MAFIAIRWPMSAAVLPVQRQYTQVALGEFMGAGAANYAGDDANSVGIYPRMPQAKGASASGVSGSANNSI